MCLLTLGYYMSVASPWASLLFCFSAVVATIGVRNFVFVQLAIIGFQVCSIILYLIGCIRTEISRKTAPFVELLSFLLIVWGFFILVFFLYFRFPTVTIWDELSYTTEYVKALLWVVAGTVFLVTYHIQRSKA